MSNLEGQGADYILNFYRCCVVGVARASRARAATWTSTLKLHKVDPRRHAGRSSTNLKHDLLHRSAPQATADSSNHSCTAGQSAHCRPSLSTHRPLSLSLHQRHRQRHHSRHSSDHQCVSNAIRSDLDSTYDGRPGACCSSGAKSRRAHMQTRPHADVRDGGGTTDQRSPMERWLGG